MRRPLACVKKYSIIPKYLLWQAFKIDKNHGSGVIMSVEV
jgi:hypothetical protein